MLFLLALFLPIFFIKDLQSIFYKQDKKIYFIKEEKVKKIKKEDFYFQKLAKEYERFYALSCFLTLSRVREKNILPEYQDYRLAIISTPNLYNFQINSFLPNNLYFPSLEACNIREFLEKH